MAENETENRAIWLYLLTEMRKQKRQNQELAEHLNVGNNTVTAWVHAHNVPKSKYLRPMAEWLNIDIDDIRKDCGLLPELIFDTLERYPKFRVEIEGFIHANLNRWVKQQRILASRVTLKGRNDGEMEVSKRIVVLPTAEYGGE